MSSSKGKNFKKVYFGLILKFYEQSTISYKPHKYLIKLHQNQVNETEENFRFLLNTKKLTNAFAWHSFFFTSIAFLFVVHFATYVFLFDYKGELNF